eukprot:SAG31_NODE_1_length_62978_cov_30.836130_9_plen_86_part_00
MEYRPTAEQNAKDTAGYKRKSRSRCLESKGIHAAHQARRSARRLAHDRECGFITLKLNLVKDKVRTVALVLNATRTHESVDTAVR